MKILKTALVLTLVGILCGAIIGLTNHVTAPIIKRNADKRAQEAYRSFFNDLTEISSNEVEENSVYLVIDIKKDSEVIGYVYRAKGTNQRGLVDLAVAFDTEGKIVAVKILETENTQGFYDKYVDAANNTLVGLIGDSKDNLNGIDNIGGVTQTGNLLNELLKDISALAKTNFTSHVLPKRVVIA